MGRTGKTRIAVVAAAVAVAGAALALLVYFGAVQLKNPDRAAFPVRGIDVSRFQGDIDWDTVRSAGIGFAYIKATEGGDLVDPKFRQNWEGAARAGVPRGAYHFFTFCRSGADQAANFLNTVPAEAGALPPAIDIEFGGNCSRRPDRDSLRKELDVFITAAAGRYGKVPVLYVKYDSYEAFIQGGYSDHPVWIQDIFFEPKLPDGRPVSIWQYSVRGHIPGIEGYVDLNAASEPFPRE
jgi:lysozyme